MEKVALFIIKLLKHPIILFGGDYRQVEAILRTKLAMDFRRSPSMFHASGKSEKTFTFQLFILLIFGLFIALGFTSIQNLMLGLTIGFTIMMVMLGSSVITEFSSVLFDHRDNQILLVRPISNRSLLLSRLLHIQVYIGFMAVALGAIPSIMIAYKHGVIAFIVYWIAVGLCAWITLLLTSFFYILLSKIVSGERFKDVISYFQIFMAIMMFGGYQLMPRFMENEAIKNTTMDIHWWTYLIPPTWVAGFVDVFTTRVFSLEIIILALLALVISVGGAIFLVRNMSGSFENVLSEGAAEKVEVEKKVESKEKHRFKIYDLFCVSETEKSGWKFSMAITKRDRKFKQAVYPSIGMIIVLAVVMIKPDFSNLAATMQKLSDNKNFFFFLFCCFFGTTALTQLPYTDTPDGAWIFRALPIEKHGHILTGAIKAMLFKFLMPILVLLFIVSTSIWGVEKLQGLLIGSMMIILINLYTIIFMKMALPFTQVRDMQQKSANMARMFLLMFLMGITIGLVYLSLMMNVWISVAVCVVLFFAIINAFSQIRNKGYILS